MIVAYLLNLIYGLLLLLLAPWILYRMVRQGRYRSGWKERLGWAPRREGSGPCIWIHAVSMGEINAIGSLVRALRERLPACEIVISSTTDTGLARAQKLYGGQHHVFYFPFDFTFALQRAFARIRPSLCVLMELEVWHNFTVIAQRRGVPVAVANGRISSGKGFPRYKRIAPLVRPMFRRLSLVLAQDETYAERFRYLGVPAERVRVVGSLKYDTAEVGDSVAGAAELAEQLHLAGPVWVAGSTGPGEEEIILDCCQKLKNTKQNFKPEKSVPLADSSNPQSAIRNQQLKLVIVPRKPERFDEVAGLIAAKGFRCVRYSRVKAGEYRLTPEDDGAVILGDTMGDLRKFYSLAAVVFVGRSLVPMGGSDMMEAAGLAKPVVVGPYTENFTDTVQKLLAGGGIEVVADREQLYQITAKLLQVPANAKLMGDKARQIILENRGATEKTVNILEKLLNSSTQH